MQDQASTEKPRRVSVKGRRGIYYREGANGRRRYEISYTDSDGRRRWRTIEGGVKEAAATLEEINSRKRRGERVAPSRVTFSEFSIAWLASQSQLRPRTRALYGIQLRVHLAPRFGHLRLGEIDEDHVAALIADMREAGYSPWTIRGVLTVLGRILGHAARRGLIADNAVRRLERGERPAPGRREQRILTRDELAALLEASGPAYRPILATAAFTGLRLGELLGLTWADVDFDAGHVHVRKQLDREGQRVEPKTRQAVRAVVLMPALGRILREHRIASPFSGDSNFVFSSERGTGLNYRNLERRGLGAAAERAQLNGAERPRLRMHDLRHFFASLLIAQGANVVYVSRQLGHASPDITLRVYSHLFDGAEHGERTRALMEASFGNVLETSGGEQRRSDASAEAGSVVDLQGFRN